MQVIDVRTSNFDAVSRIHHTLNNGFNLMTRNLNRLKVRINLWENMIRKVNVNDESYVCQLNFARRVTFQKVKTMKDTKRRNLKAINASILYEKELFFSDCIILSALLAFHF
jgi:hypothetical protein